MDPLQLTIVIPVYNEGANLPALWNELVTKITTPFVAFLTYDFDEDDTLPVAEQIVGSGETRLRLVKNNVAPGVVGAIVTGFRSADEGPVLVVMADLSDDLSKVDQMVQEYRKGFHVVVGSRYMKGGKMFGGPWFKQMLSRVAGVSLHFLRGIPTHDSTNAFKIYDGAMLQTFTIESKGGFELNLELTVKAFLNGFRIAEIPSTWRDRTAGTSRFRIWRWMPAYLKWYFYAFQPRRRRS